MSLVTLFGLLIAAGLVKMMLYGRAFVAQQRTALAHRFAHVRTKHARSLGSPYRDARDARISSLESRNASLEAELEATKEELATTRKSLAQQEALYEDLWYEAHESVQARRSPPHSIALLQKIEQAGLGVTLGFVIAAGLAVGGLSLIPTPVAAPHMSANPHRRPTMIDLTVLTAGGETFVVPQRRYVIVLITQPYYECACCFERPLVLEPTFLLVDLTREEASFRIVWFLMTPPPDPPIPRLQL